MRKQSERYWTKMKEKKVRIAYSMIPLLFLLVILGILAARRYDRTFLACGPEDSFCLDRGDYKVHVDTPDPAAVSCEVCYEVNGQEQIIASTGVKSGVGVDFEISLPSNIRNDSVRVVLFDEDKNRLPQIDTLRITRVLPVRQTVFYLVLYLAVAALLYKGFDGGRVSCLLTGFVSAAFLPFYPVFCAAPVRMEILIVTGMSVLLLLKKRGIIPQEHIVRYVFFLALSLTALYFCTESSPFYARNPWDDVSIYYSIGRGVTQGYVPYRDMFDHKGPVVFFLYALAHLLVPDCFYGGYLLESFCFSWLLYFVYQTGRLYFDEGMAGALSVISMVVLLDGDFLGYGGSCEEFAMVIYGAVLYGYLAYFAGKKACDGRWMAGMGVLLGLVFWMKFNMAVCLFVLVGVIMLHKLFGRHNILRDIAAFGAGFVFVSVLVAGYFICTDALGYLKNGYFDANLAYADVRSMGETLSVFGQNVLVAVTDNPGITLLVLLGILAFTFSSRYLRPALGRGGLAAAFVLLIGSTYVSYAYLYYYCLVAVFAVLGMIAAAGFLTDKAGKLKAGDKAPFLLVLPCLCLLFVFNHNYREAAVFSENFKLFDVCEKVLENASEGRDKTILLYRNHTVQVMTYADMKPAARYYFAPNISKKIPEINEEQDRYIHEGIGEFVLVYDVDTHPNLMEWGLYQYEQILDWRTDDESVQLYRLK